MRPGGRPAASARSRPVEDRVETLQRIDRRLRAGVNGTAALLLAAVTILGIAQVIARYVFNASLVWSEELIRLLYVWLVLVAATTAPHMRVGLVADAATGWLGAGLRVFRTLVVVALLVVLIQGALTLNASLGSDRYVTLGITKSWYWSGTIVCGVLWIVTLLTGLAGSNDGGEKPT